MVLCKVTYFLSPTLYICYPSNIYSYIICDSSYNHPHSLSLSVLSKYSLSLSLFPINWHFLHAFVNSFQGSYKNGTESGKFDCCLFSLAFLLIRPLMYIIYGFTPSVMYFDMVPLINIHPLKMINSKYPLADLLFAFLLTITHIAVLGRVIDNIEKYLYFHAAMTCTECTECTSVSICSSSLHLLSHRFMAALKDYFSCMMLLIITFSPIGKLTLYAHYGTHKKHDLCMYILYQLPYQHNFSVNVYE